MMAPRFIWMRDVARNIGAHLTNRLAKNNAVKHAAVVVRKWCKGRSLRVARCLLNTTHEKQIDFFTESMKISPSIS